MNKNYTLKELADIGAKAAFHSMNDFRSTLVRMDKNHPEYNMDQPAREAFTKAILAAIGYEFPKDEEREAFERWLSEQGDGFHPCGDADKAFTVWKAGREELRRAQMTAKEQGETKTEPAWIPWEGGECPLADTVKRWEYRTRDEFESIDPAPPKLYRWIHTGDCDDIVAYRVFEG